MGGNRKQVAVISKMLQGQVLWGIGQVESAELFSRRRRKIMSRVWVGSACQDLDFPRLVRHVLSPMPMKKKTLLLRLYS